MNRIRGFAFAALALLALSVTSAQAGVFVGFGVGGPYHPWHHHPYWYGPRVVVGLPPVYIGPAPAPAPVYVVPPPAPVYVAPTAPAPVYGQPVPTTQPASPALPPAPIPVNR